MSSFQKMSTVYLYQLFLFCHSFFCTESFASTNTMLTNQAHAMNCDECSFQYRVVSNYVVNPLTLFMPLSLGGRGWGYCEVQGNGWILFKGLGKSVKYPLFSETPHLTKQTDTFCAWDCSCYSVNEMYKSMSENNDLKLLGLLFSFVCHGLIEMCMLQNCFQWCKYPPHLQHNWFDKSRVSDSEFQFTQGTTGKNVPVYVHVCKVMHQIEQEWGNFLNK